MRLASAKPRATAADVKAVASKAAAVADTKLPTAEDGAKTLRRIVEGSVVHVGKRAISVEYEVTKEGSYEMVLPFSANVTVEGVSALSDLKPGDTVKVGVEQTYKDVPDGERMILKTEALVVVFVRHADEPAAPDADVKAVQ